MLLESQYETLSKLNLNVSGLVRDLLGDYLSDSTITLQVSEDTRKVYDQIISNSGATDADVEVHLRHALAKVLEGKIEDMRTLHAELIAEESS